MTKQPPDVAHQAMRKYLGDHGITHDTTETVDALIQLLRNLEENND